MNRNQSNLEDKLAELAQDLEDYSWNIKDLNEDEKNVIKNLYKAWKTSLNQKIIIENLHNTNIRVMNNITQNSKLLWPLVEQHNTLFFTNCSNMTIIVNPKINHITLENCKNINFRTKGGSISGMDIINSSNITTIFDSHTVNFVDISNSTQCLFILSESVAKNIIMITTSSYNINFKIVADNSGVCQNTFKTNMNLFQPSAIYNFVSQDNNLSLYITIPQTGEGYIILPN